jgi:hypothetical protein
MRFSIRDLLWATALVAMGLGWWIDHARLERRLAEQEAEIEQASAALEVLGAAFEALNRANKQDNE